MDASPFARLPRELVRLILERAAAADLDAAVALTRVSRRVRAWVEPLLYHTIVLRTPHTLHLFRTTLAAKPPAFFAAHVRNLFVNGDDPCAAALIHSCAHLRRLAAYPPALVALHDDDATCSAAPYEITLMGAVDDVPWASPLFAYTRTLYLGLEPPSPETACDISLLPALQCLAFPYDGDDPDALLLAITTLLESTTIRILLVLVNDDDGHPDRERKGCIWPKLARLSDTRLLVGTEPSFDGEDWLAMIQDGSTLWDGCEHALKDWRKGLS